MNRSVIFYSQEQHQDKIMMDMKNFEIDDEFFFAGNLLEKLLLIREFTRNKINYTDKQYEDIYAYGFNFFSAGQYAKAKNIFKLLLLVDHMKVKAYIALGACLQKLELFDNALHVYASAHLLEPKNSSILLNIGLCHLSLKDYFSAECGFLLACVTDMQAPNSSEIGKMAERMWKMTRVKQKKAAITLEQSLIHVD